MYLLQLIWNAVLLVQATHFVSCVETMARKTIDHDSYGRAGNPTAEFPRPIMNLSNRKERAHSEPVFHEISVPASVPAVIKRGGSRKQWTQRPTLMDIALQASAREGLEAMTDLYGRIMPQIVKNGQLLADNHPAALLSKFSAPADDNERSEMAAFATILAARAFRKNYKHFNDLARQAHAPKISLRRTALEGLCPPRDPPTCPAASGRYRTHDGTCNNRRHPRWGSAQMPFNRFLPPEYDDGVDSIRNAVEGGPLSSSRFVSLLVHGAKDGEAPLTLMLAMWGQLLDHDLTSTAQPRSINGSVPSCCGRKDFHPSCFPIKVPLDDPWLAPLKVRCLEFLRSAPAQRRDCVLSWREQTNQATSYIDASPIYSNSAKSSDNARVFRNGLLVFGRGNPTEDVCQRGAIATQCIRAGDGRSGEQPGLLALHHVWVGEHNRIAMELSEMNLHWSDEKLYQETRRIIGAIFQHVTYREFLPIILGREVCKLFDLELLNTGYYEGYNPKVNPTVANSFAAAAFRFGHSLVQNSYIRCDRNHNVISNNVSLHEEFQRGDIGSAGSLHRLIRGLATQRALKRDEFITPELTNHLFQTPGFPFGLDLAAINIQRGRDHGIPSYTAWRIPCGLTPITDWDDLENVVGPESARRIGHAYRSVHDIDLFVGGIAERPVVGGLVGPTFACVIAQQFSNSRKGDRFWYENGAFESSFTPAQLHSLRRVSLAQVLCRSVGGGTFQPHIFIPAEFPGNERSPCGIGPLSMIDLTPWLEQDPFVMPTFALQSSAMETQIPERIFDIIPMTDIDADILNSVQIIKENKAGFSNRIQSIGNSSMNSPQLHVSSIDFVPNSPSRFQTTTDVTNINDKLDIRRKRPTNFRKPTQKPISGIHNKLDKGTKITLNVKGINQHRIKTTTRRTVIVNNIPIELRNANTDNAKLNTKTKSPVNKTDRHFAETSTKAIDTNFSSQIDGPEPRTEDHEDTKQTDNTLATTSEGNSTRKSTEFVDGKLLTEEHIIHIPPTLSEESINLNTTEVSLNKTDNSIPMANTLDLNNHNVQFSMNTDLLENKNVPHTLSDRLTELQNGSLAAIDPMAHSSAEDHTRVKRQLPLVFANDFPRIREARSTKTSNKHKSSTTLKSTHSQLNRTTNTTPTTITKTRKIPKTPKTTERNVELRQYHSNPIYTRPQKVVLDGPNADQYEIEINIRQSNKVPSSRPITNYPEYTTVYKPYAYGYDRYSPHYLDYATSIPPAYGYYQPPPTIPSTTLLQTKRTKPPTIIYLNEHDERTTTKHPGLFQNFLTFATNGFPGNNYKPQPYSTQKEKPSLEAGTQIDLLHSPHSSNSPSLQYASRPQAHYPASTSSFSQVDGYTNTGTVHASSSAVSSGSYGSIVGVASANGADSTFSFNIRPKPSVSQGQDIMLSAKPASSSYGLLPPRKSPYTQISPTEFENLPPLPTPQSDLYYNIPNRESLISPFSTAHARPQSQNYYSKTQIGPQLKKPSNSNFQQSFPTHQSTIRPVHHDYDYMSRTLETLTNLTNSEEDIDMLNDYDYDDISAENGNARLVPLSKKYDKDGYLRPEHMVDNLFKIKEHPDSTDTINKNSSTLDDNYVMPVLNQSQLTVTESHLSVASKTDLLNLTEPDTNFPDLLGKHFNNDILAEDYDDDLVEPFIISKTAALTAIKDNRRQENSHSSTIAFAPIKVLTNPERPDNWVIFNSPQEKPLLPEPPEIKPDSSATAEFPTPLWSLSNILLEDLRANRAKISETRTAVDVDADYETPLGYTEEPTQTETTDHRDQLESATSISIFDFTEPTSSRSKTIIDPDYTTETYKRT